MNVVPFYALVHRPAGWLK